MFSNKAQATGDRPLGTGNRHWSKVAAVAAQDPNHLAGVYHRQPTGNSSHKQSGMRLPGSRHGPVYRLQSSFPEEEDADTLLQHQCIGQLPNLMEAGYSLQPTQNIGRLPPPSLDHNPNPGNKHKPLDKPDTFVLKDGLRRPSAFLQIDGSKMSQSAGMFYNQNHILQRGPTPLSPGLVSEGRQSLVPLQPLRVFTQETTEFDLSQSVPLRQESIQPQQDFVHSNVNAMMTADLKKPTKRNPSPPPQLQDSLEIHKDLQPRHIIQDKPITIRLTGGNMPLLKLVADDGRVFTLMTEDGLSNSVLKHRRMEDSSMPRKKEKIIEPMEVNSKNRSRISDEHTFSNHSDTNSQAKVINTDDTNQDHYDRHSFFVDALKQTALKGDPMIQSSRSGGGDSGQVNEIVRQKRDSIMGIFPVGMALIQQSKEAQIKMMQKNQEAGRIDRFAKRNTMAETALNKASQVVSI